jgi:hypothetical protein
MANTLTSATGMAPLLLPPELCYNRARFMRLVCMIYDFKVGDFDPLQLRSGIASFLSFDLDVDPLGGAKGFFYDKCSRNWCAMG